MKHLLLQVLTAHISIMPFIEFNDNFDSSDNNHEIQFLYPSSGEPHKNHKNLISAWILLAQAGRFPTLHLTLDELLFPELTSWIRLQIDRYDLRIINLGYINDHGEMLYFLKKSKCLIFPSTLESFGMPLLEAEHFKVPILAPELDYVRDLVVPNEVFDPQSPLSISRAVQRFLGYHYFSEQLTPKAFIANLFR